MNTLQTNLDKTYSNCISLGWFCGTASSLSKLGLRSSSGPFDWCYSYYRDVLTQIEDDFKNFLNIDNLTVDKSNPTIFDDIKYNFHYIHDVKKDLYEEYDSILRKYTRRIESFRKAIIQPTVFFRCIRNQEEIDFINAEYERAEKPFKSFNKENRVIYLYHNGLNALTDKVESTNLNIEKYVGNIYDMRLMFNSSHELVDLCSKLLPSELIKKNTDFDIMQNTHKAIAGYIFKCVSEHINGLDIILTEAMEATKNEGIYLWGAGRFGIPLAHYLRARDVVIRGIIDNSSCGKEIDGFKIISFEEVPDNVKIFITVSDKDSTSDIENQITAVHSHTLIVKYTDLSRYINNKEYM